MSLIGVLAELADLGWTDELRAEPDGMVRCPSGDATVPAADLRIVAQRRLEGASDPADMQLVVVATSASSDCGGVLTLGFGPNADERDADVLAALTLDDDLPWPPPPSGSVERAD